MTWPHSCDIAWASVNAPTCLYRREYTAGSCTDQKSWMSSIAASRIFWYGGAAGRCAPAVPAPTASTAATTPATTNSAKHLLST
jgi:hypothetical protein